MSGGNFFTGDNIFNEAVRVAGDWGFSTTDQPRGGRGGGGGGGGGQRGGGGQGGAVGMGMGMSMPSMGMGMGMGGGGGGGGGRGGQRQGQQRPRQAQQTSAAPSRFMGNDSSGVASGTVFNLGGRSGSFSVIETLNEGGMAWIFKARRATGGGGGG